MKPIAIFRHSPGEGPGYFATFLNRHSIPHTLLRIDAGDPVPADPAQFAGLCFMGGPMSVNDGLPWIARELDLIRAAVAADVACLGHCLGGQLMARALGGAVGRNPVKEIGWGMANVADNAAAREWFGELSAFFSFHWHGETFSIPAGAFAVLSTRYCDNQAFVIGRHLGLQCHVEMTESMIRLWNRQWADEVSGNAGPSVQTPSQMYEDMDARLVGLHQVADRLYGHWIQGLPRD